MALVPGPNTTIIGLGTRPHTRLARSLPTVGGIVSSLDQIFRAHPADSSKNRVWTLSHYKNWGKFIYAGPAEAKLDWSGLPTLVYANLQMRALARRIRLGGSGGMLPQGNFLKIGCSEMASEVFFGPKNIT